MYYIMLKSPFLYVSLKQTIEVIFKLIGEKKMVEKNREFQIVWPIDPENKQSNVNKQTKIIRYFMNIHIFDGWKEKKNLWEFTCVWMSC